MITHNASTLIFPKLVLSVGGLYDFSLSRSERDRPSASDAVGFSPRCSGSIFDDCSSHKLHRWRMSRSHGICNTPSGSRAAA